MIGRLPVFSLICLLCSLEELCAVAVAELLELTAGVPLLEELLPLGFVPLLFEEPVVALLSGVPVGEPVSEPLEVISP